MAAKFSEHSTAEEHLGCGISSGEDGRRVRSAGSELDLKYVRPRGGDGWQTTPVDCNLLTPLFASELGSERVSNVSENDIERSLDDVYDEC